VAFLPTLKANGVPQTDLLLTQSQAVDGQKVLAKHFDAGSGSPVVIIANEANYKAVIAKAVATPGISVADVQRKPAAVAAVAGPPAAFGAPAALTDPVVVNGKVLINATLKAQPDSAEAEAVVKQLRADLPSVDASVLVGGETAIALDTNETAQADLLKIVPIVLLVILVILMLLLRSILAPLILIGTVVISFAAAMGVSAIVFNNVFGFPGADASVPLFGFVFLVALGIDYNIFLMTRVREESLKIGTRAGILKGLAVTGGVITSAGIVLAATFAALGVIPLLFLVQLAFIVSFGVMLDTIIVRSLLVPALSYDIGRAIWWPSKLAKAAE
jgi:RND superfamily putative drug exporter